MWRLLSKNTLIDLKQQKAILIIQHVPPQNNSTRNPPATLSLQKTTIVYRANRYQSVLMMSRRSCAAAAAPRCISSRSSRDAQAASVFRSVSHTPHLGSRVTTTIVTYQKLAFTPLINTVPFIYYNSTPPVRHNYSYSNRAFACALLGKVEQMSVENFATAETWMLWWFKVVLLKIQERLKCQCSVLWPSHCYFNWYIKALIKIIQIS